MKKGYDFLPEVAQWFEETLGAPTHTQSMGWPVLSSGHHALICAPTGTGKTLCAFLLSINALLEQAQEGRLREGVQVLYISPLKALGNDIARNLTLPLEGIAAKNPAAKEIKMGVRTGDTTQGERRRQRLHPPHILITTPESLYLMLTSQAAASMFSGLRTVIVDEAHALLSEKRGAHLTLSLERLACFGEFQRVGLSATVEPPEEAAGFIGGDREVVIVDARREKKVDLLVEYPVADHRALPEHTIWPEIARCVYDYAKDMRQTLVFCNLRRITENVASQINQLAGDGFATTHHGSLDKERRLEAERRFKSGELRCLCATASMELGIDVGEVDMVIQVGSPFSASQGLQRMGRAGHRPGETSSMRILPRMAQDARESAFIARMMLMGEVEPMHAPRLCLDVLAQHIVSMVCTQTWRVEDILALVRRAHGYHDMDDAQLRCVLKMLRGDYEHEAGRDARPRIHWDEAADEVHTDGYGRLLALSGSTIPDRGYYPVITGDGVRVGELEEEFVYEARVGDRFTLGAFVWAVVQIAHDRVVVMPSSGPAKAPFWRGRGPGRPAKTGEAFGREMAYLERADNRQDAVALRYPVDMPTACAVSDLLSAQMEILGCLPTDERLIVELFHDDAGECFWALHCMLGGQVNLALATLLREESARLTGRDVTAFHNDDGIVLHLTGEQKAPDGLLAKMDPDKMLECVLRELPTTPLYSIVFRQAAATALMLGGGRQGKRNPLWVQRLRGAEALTRAAQAQDHPLVVEAYRECMERYMDMERAKQLLRDVRSGAVQVVEVRTEHPTPMTRGMMQGMIEQHVYYEAVPQDIAGKALAQPGVVVPTSVSGTRAVQAKDEDGLYALLLKRGTLSRDELAGMQEQGARLVAAARALWQGDLLVASHEAQAFASARADKAQGLVPFLLRHLRAAGEAETGQLLLRFGDEALAVLESLAATGEIASYARDGRHYFADEGAVRRAMVARARERRAQILTQEPEHYAALLPQWQRAQGQIPAARIEDALRPLYGFYIDFPLWESCILPARVTRYRAAALDALLLSGGGPWRYKEGKVAFFPPTQLFEEPPAQEEGPLYAALREGGAQFARALTQRTGLSGAQLEREMDALVQAGLAVCDGLGALRKKNGAQSAKRAAKMRAMMATGEGRWEAAGEPAPLPLEEQITRIAERWAILCRETAAVEGWPWTPLLELLKRMEYRDEVRRGYFVRGLSGAQFVLRDHFGRVVDLLENPQGVAVLCAADPAQAWGAPLPGGGFSRLGSSAVVMDKGKVLLSAERHGGKMTQQGSDAEFAEGLILLAEAFRAGRIWTDRSRITAHTYPAGTKEAFLQAGFAPDMLDFTLWKR